MKFKMQIQVFSGMKGTITEQTNRQTGEVSKLDEPIYWANLQAATGLNNSDTSFGLKTTKLPCSHELYDQISTVWTDKNKDFEVLCEMRSVRDRNNQEKMTPFAVELA